MPPTATPPQPETVRHWTYDEFAAKSPESNLPTELWDGEIFMSAAPRPIHQRIVLRLARIVEDSVAPRRLGQVFISPIDVVLGPSRAVQPDIVFVAAARASIITETCLRGVPDLLVEVISEGTWRRDRLDKKALYEQAGVAEYWIIDPDSRLIEVFTLADGSYRLHARGVATAAVNSVLLPGLTVAFDHLDT